MHKILMATERKKDKELLSDWLGNNFSVQTISNPREILSDSFDICLLDRKTFFQIRSHIDKRKKKDRDAAPCFILIIPRKRIEEIGQDVDRIIDDLLYTPLEKTEFDLRLACQLRLKAIRATNRAPKERGVKIRGKERAVDGRLRILAVDDYSLNRNIIELYLKKHDVTIAERGAKAVEMLGEQNFDIVLMDIQMPEMDGYQTAEKIRDPSSKVLNPDVPIIAMSAREKSSELRRAAESGMDGFVGKPLEKDALLIEIKKILARKKNSSPIQAGGNDFFSEADSKKQESEKCSGTVAKPSPGSFEVDGSSKHNLMDRKATIALMGGKESIVKKVCDALISDLPKKIESLKQSVQSGNFAETRRISHDLKSGARCVCAEKAAELSCELEKLCLVADKERIRETLPVVEKTFEALYRELRAYRKA